MPGRGRLLVALCCALACAVPAATARTTPGERTTVAVDVYGGVGSWLDIFAGSPWKHPQAVVRSLREHGVRTFYVQTSNYSQRADVVAPAALGRLLDAAHEGGISVVSWYLPSFAHPALDARRSLAAIRFRSATGERFDSFALDIEASVVGDARLRNARLLALGRRLRAAAPEGYPLGAIIPSPVGMKRKPRYWPGFPYAPLARLFDAFVPMAYFSYHVHTPAAAYSYARDVVRTIRVRTGLPDVPIHLIGGVAAGASAAEVGGFARAASECGVDGVSLYAFPQTTDAQWSRLAEATLGSRAGC